MTSIGAPVLVTAQTILVIDDDYALGAALGDVLVGPGRDVIVCRDIESARMVLENQIVTHIITDLRFSSFFGYEGLHIVDAVRRSLSAIPVVVISGYATDDIRREAEMRGATAVLQKPVTAKDLERFIGQSVGSVGTVTQVPTIDEVLGGGMLATVFQPIVWNDNPNHVVGFEALTRLRTESLFANPELLFRYAERKNRVVDLELAAATSAITTGRELTRLGILSINLHAAVFSEPDRFTDTLMNAAVDANVPMQRIVLEITEQAPLPDVERVEAVTAVMRAAGLRFAFDDLGLAYSHLLAIAAVRPSYLKISQHFGTACESDDVKRKIVENIDALARSFSSEIVLEGIESAETAAFARELGIRFGQGFYYSRPTTIDMLMRKYA
jgi:EAL domain-containing protein (putative c-di-GMP-specific phosphodiesterase class I)